MALRSWRTVVANAIKAFKSGEYVYFYGARNIVLTTENMNYLMFVDEETRKHFAKYSNAELEQIQRNSLGKRGLDCSAYTGGDKTGTGDDQWSKGQFNNCSKYTTPAQGRTASLLFTTWGGTGRHIGLDIGNGYCLHIGWESTDAAIREGRAGIMLQRIEDVAWEQSGESKAVDYTDAYSPYEPTTKLVEQYILPSKKPKWVGEVTTLINVRTSPEIKNSPNGYPLNPLPQYPMLGKGNLIDVCDDTKVAGWYYVRIAGKYYGWVSAQYVKTPTPKTPEVGDKVKFTGQKIYVSSYANGKGVAVPNFTAKVVEKNDKAHPYLIKSTGKDGYEGWANAADIIVI